MHIKDSVWGVSTLLGWVLLSWLEKNNRFFIFFFDSTSLKWLCECLVLSSCCNPFLSPSECRFCKINHSWESEVLLLSSEITSEVWGAARSQRRYARQEEGSSCWRSRKVENQTFLEVRSVQTGIGPKLTPHLPMMTLGWLRLALEFTLRLPWMW